LIPEQNVKDLTEIPDNIKNCLVIHPVKWIDEVLEYALERMPKGAEDVVAPEVLSEAQVVEVSTITKH
jgi:ATP-dependent Lon protease